MRNAGDEPRLTTLACTPCAVPPAPADVRGSGSGFDGRSANGRGTSSRTRTSVGSRRRGTVRCGARRRSLPAHRRTGGSSALEVAHDAHRARSAVSRHSLACARATVAAVHGVGPAKTRARGRGRACATVAVARKRVSRDALGLAAGGPRLSARCCSPRDRTKCSSACSSTARTACSPPRSSSAARSRRPASIRARSSRRARAQRRGDDLRAQPSVRRRRAEPRRRAADAGAEAGARRWSTSARSTISSSPAAGSRRSPSADCSEPHVIRRLTGRYKL